MEIRTDLGFGKHKYFDVKRVVLGSKDKMSRLCRYAMAILPEQYVWLMRQQYNMHLDQYDL